MDMPASPPATNTGAPRTRQNRDFGEVGEDLGPRDVSAAGDAVLGPATVIEAEGGPGSRRGN